MTMRWAGILAGVLVLMQVAGGASAAELVPHRAFYAASLGSAKAASGISRIDGSYTVELERACDGWIIRQQLTTEVGVGGSTAITMDARFTAWESLNGRTYRFSVAQRVGENEDRFKGEARLDTRGGSARYIVPAGVSVDLPAGTLFPVGHMAALVDQAVLGANTVASVVFDGSDGTGAKRVSAFIANRKPGPADAMGIAKGPAWPVRMAYYPMEGNAATPEFEVAAEMLANGVTRRLTMDFGDFEAQLDLVSVEALPLPACP